MDDKRRVPVLPSACVKIQGFSRSAIRTTECDKLADCQIGKEESKDESKEEYKEPIRRGNRLNKN